MTTDGKVYSGTGMKQIKDEAAIAAFKKYAAGHNLGKDNGRRTKHNDSRQ